MMYYLVKWRKIGFTRDSDWFSALCENIRQKESLEKKLLEQNYEVKIEVVD